MKGETYRRRTFALIAYLSGALMVYSASHPSGHYYPTMAVEADTLYAQVKEGTYVAFDLTARNVRWRFTDPHLGLFTKPAFSGGTVMVAATRNAASEILSLRNGSVAWRTAYVPLSSKSSPVSCGSVVLVADPWRGYAQALDVATGQQLWRRGEQTYFFFPPPAIRGGTAFYVVAYRGMPSPWGIVTVDCASGTVIGSVRVGGIGFSNFPILIQDDRAILIAYHPHSGTVVTLFDISNKDVLWRLHIPRATVARNSPIVKGNKLILTEDGLWIVDLSVGRIATQCPINFAGAPPAVVDDKIIVQVGERVLAGIDLNSGRQLWETSLRDRIVSNIVGYRSSAYVQIGGQRLVEVGAIDGGVVHSSRLE